MTLHKHLGQLDISVETAKGLCNREDYYIISENELCPNCKVGKLFLFNKFKDFGIDNNLHRAYIYKCSHCLASFKIIDYSS